MRPEQIASRLRSCRCNEIAAFTFDVEGKGARHLSFMVFCSKRCGSRGEVIFYGAQRIERAIAAWNVANARPRTVRRRARIERRARKRPLRTHAIELRLSTSMRTARGILR